MSHLFALAWFACSGSTPPPPKPEPPTPPAEPEKPREQLHRMMVHQGGVERTAWIHLPKGGGAGRPVVVALAGGKLGEGRKMVQLFDHWFDRGVILVFPNAKNGGEDTEPEWEGVGRGKETMDDVEFLKALADQVVRKHDADRNKVFAAGFAEGGFEVWQLACFAGDVYKGFAPVAAAMPRRLAGVCNTTGGPHPLLVVAGTDDPKVMWTGRDQALGVPESVDVFAKKNGCDPKSAAEQLLEDTVLDDGARVKRHTWTCSGAPVQLLEVAGGGHAWPRKDAKDRGMDKVCRDIDTADEIMAFFGIGK